MPELRTQVNISSAPTRTRAKKGYGKLLRGEIVHVAEALLRGLAA